MIPHALSSSPLFGLTLTLGAYALALVIHARVKQLNPLLMTALMVMGFLLLMKVPVADYRVGGDLISLMLAPATAALAVPLYKHRVAIRRRAAEVFVTVVAGGLVGIFAAAACALLLRGSREVVLSVLGKSVTTPIAMEIARAMGGSVELGATVAVLSGLLGAVVGPRLLRVLGFRSSVAIGLGIGVASHGIGTSSVLRQSELQGTYAGLAMALNGILTAALLTPLAPVIQGWL